MQERRLAATEIACRRGERILFRRLSFTLEAGDALHVAGANGIGKSSLIRMLAGLLRPVAGTIATIGSVALLDERHALDPHLPLGHALHFWCSIDGARRGDQDDGFGLADLMDVPVRYLSTGQKKRAALARLAGQGAAVWLLDEPLNGLDRDAVVVVENLVAAHCRSGGIAVIASHQPFRSPGLQRLDLERFAA